MSKELGQRILDILQKKNISQKDLAMRTGVSEGVISRYISGDREPKPDMLANIATALNTTSDYLLGIEKNDFDFPKVERLLARNSSKLNDQQRKALITALFGEG